jgi:hypothetical protein
LKIEPDFYGYIAYKLTNNRQLELITQEKDLIANYKPKFKLNSRIKSLKYLSAMFVPQKNQLIHCMTYESRSNSFTYETLVQKMDLNNNKLKENRINYIQYKAMFYIEGRAFAIDANSNVYEVSWGWFGIITINLIVSQLNIK